MNLNELNEMSAKINLANAIIEKRETSRVLMKLLLSELNLTGNESDINIYDQLVKLEDEFKEATELLRTIVKESYARGNYAKDTMQEPVWEEEAGEMKKTDLCVS